MSCASLHSFLLESLVNITHVQSIKLSHSEYIKSQLLNKNSRFRTIRSHSLSSTYLLWQKEMRKLSAGICNLLKCTRSQLSPTVSTLLNGVKTSDDTLEAQCFRVSAAPNSTGSQGKVNCSAWFVSGVHLPSFSHFCVPSTRHNISQTI